MSEKCHEATYAVQQIAAYSITSSAMASSVGGISRPSTLAVVRLMSRLLDRQVARLRPAQNLVDEVGSAPPQDREVRSIGQETSVDVLPQTLALSVVARPAPKY
jgi:hypothetical protein